MTSTKKPYVAPALTEIEVSPETTIVALWMFVERTKSLDAAAFFREALFIAHELRIVVLPKQNSEPEKG